MGGWRGWVNCILRIILNYFRATSVLSRKHVGEITEPRSPNARIIQLVALYGPAEAIRLNCSGAAKREERIPNQRLLSSIKETLL